MTERERIFLEIVDLKKGFRSGDTRQEVLRGLSFSVSKGEFCVLLGPSGSGKSTLLNILGGIDQADSGEISIAGDKLEDLSEKKLTEYRRKHLGYVFQMYNLIGNLNVKENIEVGAYLSDDPLDIDELLNTLGLYEHRYKLPNQLSGGQQQRVSIGRAIVKNPDILLCDEPTGALDYNTSKEILKLIEDVNIKYGNTVIMVTHDPDSNLFPTKRLDRPHILKCEKTGKYVCWIKLSGAEACFVVLQSDHLEGPYDIVYENYQPNGIGIGDFDLILDDKTGKAYLYFDQNHRGMVTMELADDFCSAKEEICRQYENLTPPFTREAPAVFHHDGKFYMITSGMTGYIPNKSDLAISDGLEKEFISLGNPHEEDDSCASFNSQISKIFHVEGSDLWIAMADRWVPDFPIDANMADIFTRAIASHYDPKHFSATEEEHKILENSATLETAQTKFSEYVWLPILFDEKGIPYIKWFDEWAVNEFI